MGRQEGGGGGGTEQRCLSQRSPKPEARQVRGGASTPAARPARARRLPASPPFPFLLTLPGSELTWNSPLPS